MLDSESLTSFNIEHRGKLIKLNNGNYSLPHFIKYIEINLGEMRVILCKM